PSLQPERMMDHLASVKLPTVIVLRPVPNETRFDQVAVDHHKLLTGIGREYIRRGHRSILLIVQFPKLILTRLRIEGLKAAIAESDEQVALKIIWSSEEEKEFDAVFIEALLGGERPTAIILSNAIMAAWAIRALR